MLIREHCVTSNVSRIVKFTSATKADVEVKHLRSETIGGNIGIQFRDYILVLPKDDHSAQQSCIKVCKAYATATAAEGHN